MILPDWIVDILVALRLKKPQGFSESDLKEKLRNLNQEREKQFRELAEYEEQVKKLSCLSNTKAKSDMAVLQDKINECLESLAALNNQIAEIRKILHLRRIDDRAEEIQNMAADLQKLIVKAQHASDILENNRDALKEANSITFVDPTLTAAPAVTEPVKAAPKETIGEKNQKTVSEIGSENV